MEKEKIYAHVDPTLLKPYASWEEIKKLCDEAVWYKTASVCIPPTYIKRVKEAYGGEITVCTVIGFPLGYNTEAVKVFETEQAISDGADEIDTVIGISDVKNRDYDKILQELKAVRKAAGEKVLKVIIETCYLSGEEKIRLCEIVTESGADYIKTSTGFGTGGATMEDILLFKEHIGDGIKMKAAGGIRNRQDMENFLEAGCERLGTSSAVAILETEVN